MNRAKLSSVLFTLVILVLLTAACVPATPAAQPQQPAAKPQEPAATTAPAAQGPSGTITYFTFSAAPDHMKDLDAMIQAFQAANPGVQVKVETAPFDDYFTKLRTLIAGGQAPDVFELNYENFVDYASKDTLLDLNPLIAGDKNFDPKVFYPRAYDLFKADGKQYGLSESFSDVVLFYNKDLFEKAGLALPTDDWTWDDAMAAAKKLTDAGAGQWGLFKPTQFWEFYKTAYQFGCDFFNADKTATLINDPKCVDALNFMVSLSQKEKVMPTDAEMGGVGDDALFKQGKVAMWVNGIWQFAAMKDAPFKWDIAVEPGAARKGTHFFSNAVVASKDTKNPEAAWAWLKFFTSSPEAAKTRVASAWELPALNNPDLFKDYLAQTPPANRQAVFKSLEDLVTPPVIAKQNEMQDAINAQLDKAKQGLVTPQQALDAAKQEVDALLKK